MKKYAAGLLGCACALFVASAAFSSIDKPTLTEHYYLGEYYADTGQYQKAVANYRDMIGKYPNTRQAERGWLNMGACYYQLMLGARGELRKARERAGVTAGEIERLESTVESYKSGAISSYRKVVAQFPASKAKAIVMMGRTYAALGAEGEEDARLEFQKVIDNYPEEAGCARILLGDTHAAAKNWQSAAKVYSAAAASCPEVASLAALKEAGVYSSAGDCGRALDGYERVISCLGIDGAYSSSYEPMGAIMKKAMAGKGGAERSLGNAEGELAAYRDIISRYPATNLSIEAVLGLAEACWSNGAKEDATKLLRQTALEYSKSIWAVRSLLLLAKLQGATKEAATTYGEVIGAFPQSVFWIEAQMGLARTYLGMADEEEDPVMKKELQEKARGACNALLSAYPFCPEGDEARDYMKSRGL